MSGGNEIRGYKPRIYIYHGTESFTYRPVTRMNARFPLFKLEKCPQMCPQDVKAMRFSWSLVPLILSAFRACETRLKITHKNNKGRD